MNYTHQEIFNIGIAIANKEISKSDGIELLIKKTNINRGSAQMILGQIFPKLFFGEVFTRTLSAQLFDDLLFLLLRNYGTEKLEIALSALKQHIDYIQTKGDSKVKLRKIVQKYSDLLMQSIVEDINEIVIDEREQNELVDFFKKEKSRDELIAELQKNTTFEDEEVIVNVKKYKRNNKTIALIKLLRNFECQICKKFIKKRDGSRYVEAAHINPKHKKGQEIAENIILLCPNHHKEFDYGDLSIIEQTNDKIEFNLNGTDYIVNLKIS